jgi:hypothetical protein
LRKTLKPLGSNLTGLKIGKLNNYFIYSEKNLFSHSLEQKSLRMAQVPHTGGTCSLYSWRQS